jgi:hypothetical protein
VELQRLAGRDDPQEAYALSAQFAPCRQPNDRMTTSADQSVTWLLSGPSIGVAYLRATCRGAFRGDYLYRSFLVLAKGTFNGRHDTWNFDGFQKRLPFPPPLDPTLTPSLRVPSLTDLFPADDYNEVGPWRPEVGPQGLRTPRAGTIWVALTPRDYVLGLVRESVTRPQEALTTTVGGLAGWVTEANGMATIVAARADGAVFFFAGTGSASDVEALAARALPRAEEALGGPLPPAITPAPAAITPSPGT